MIGCPSHCAPLGLMVFRPGRGGRREQRGGGGGEGMDREKVLCRDQFVPFVRIGFYTTWWPERGTFIQGPASQYIVSCPLTDLLLPVSCILLRSCTFYQNKASDTMYSISSCIIFLCIMLPHTTNHLS